jgi:hypothetical protein
VTLFLGAEVRWSLGARFEASEQQASSTRTPPSIRIGRAAALDRTAAMTQEENV